MALQHKGFYLLRTPLLSPEDLTHFNREVNECGEDFVQKIFARFDNELLQEALYIASPALYNEYLRLRRMPAAKEKALKKMAISLYKYFIRMCTRATPYGLFAGYAMGYIGSQTALEFSGNPLLRQSRLDCFCLSEIVLHLLQDGSVKAVCRFYPNNTIYVTQQGYRYIEYSTHNNQYNYFLSGFSVTPEIDLLLAAATNGASIAHLAQLLVTDDISHEEAEAFVDELIENKILLSELEPKVTGEDHLDYILAFFEQHQLQPPAYPVLCRVKQLLQQHHSVTELKQVIQLIKDLLPHSNNSNIIQVDARLHTISNSIDETIITSITNQLEELRVLNHQFKITDLEAFKTSFTERYQDREVPLSIALDPDMGIGYGLYVKENTVAPGILQNLPLAVNYTESPRGGEAFVRWLQSLLITALTNKQYEIELLPQDLGFFKKENTKLPPSLYVIGALHGGTGNEESKDSFYFDMHSIAGPSAANLMARFCCNYPELTTAITALLDEEAALFPEAVLPEITHLSQARLGNILLRPALRKYELPLVTPALAEREYQSPLSELSVSVVNDQIILRNTRLNKEVLPRLSSAHNFSRQSIAVYKFLADLQYQPYSFLSKWTWAGFKNEVFLPRVRYKNIILHKAAWYITPAVFDRYGLTYTTEAAFIKSIGVLSRLLSIPAEVAFTDGDNTLLLQTTSPISLAMLYKTFMLEKALPLQENIAAGKKSFFSHQEKSKINELIIPLGTSPASMYKAPDFLPAQSDVQRSFMPGSDWLYIKLYSGYATADMLVTNLLYPFAVNLQEKGIIKKWFFIRYTDPDHHLRIRFYNNDKGFWKEVMEQFYRAAAPWVAEGRVTKIQIDSYERELERYGPAQIDFTESFFHLDSQVSALLLSIPEITDIKWLTAMLSCDSLLNDFGCSLTMKYHVAKSLATAYFEEAGGTDILAVKLNEKYRQARASIDGAFDEADSTSAMQGVKNLLHQRSQQMLQLMEMHSINKGDVHFSYRPATSFIHMSLNRLFTASPRKHEMLVYHHLSRHYESALARLKNQQYTK
jgi:lantibiotic biosynthesis protein